MTLSETADRLLQAAVDRGVVPGVVAMVTDGEASIYERAFGERELGTGKPMTGDTVMWIASMTKAVAAAGAMKLVEEGRLQLDSPAKEVLPWFGEAQVLDGFDGDRPRLRAPARDVTLRHLLTHTSGFGYTYWNADLKRFAKTRDHDDPDRLRALKMPMVFDPGTDWLYSIGIDWAGVMIEEVTGQSLGAYLKETVFDPLGMNDTAFYVPEDRMERMSRMHRKTADGIQVTDPAIPTSSPELEGGGGGIYSTMNDYVRFLRMLLNEGRAGDHRILKPETVRMMSVNQIGDLRVRSLKSEVPALSCDVDIFPGIEKTWGLSFMINEQDAPTGRPAGSLAWAGLANSHFWVDPKNGIAGIFAAQMYPFVEEGFLRLYQDFEKAVYDSLQAARPEEPAA